MNANIIDPSTFSPEKVIIPDNATQEEWREIHSTILLCRKASRAWLAQSRNYASERWGADYVAEAEEQMELALGLPEPKERQQLNPEDKSRAIVTIEGIALSFGLWHRKMDAEIDRWDRSKLQKALDLIAPIEAEARRIRARLEGLAS